MVIIRHMAKTVNKLETCKYRDLVMLWYNVLRTIATKFMELEGGRKDERTG